MADLFIPDVSSLRLVVHPTQPQVELAVSPQHHTTLPNGQLWCLVYHIDDTFHMRFPGFADFIVDGSDNVDCLPVTGTGESTLLHLFANQVVPAALSLRHRFVFHGSGVSINGIGVGFFGASGLGKSTLATFLARRGHPILSDDGLELRESDTGLLALPNRPSVRLWQDSQAALLPEDIAAEPAISYTSKTRFSVQGWLPICESSVPFRFAFFLGNGSATKPTLTTLPPREAHMAWISCSFLLDVHGKDTIRAQFHHVTRIVQTTHCYQLDYPREYVLLPDVEAAVLAVVADETASTQTVRPGA